MASRLCNSFEDWAPVDFIYGCPIFKWVAVTWLGHRDSSPKNYHQGSMAYCTFWTLLYVVLEFVDLSHHTIAIPLHCHYTLHTTSHHIYGLVQDCSISIANVLEILQSCTKPSICNTCLFSVLFILQFVLDFLSYHSYYGCFQNISSYKILQNCIITPCFVATLLMNHYLNQCWPLGTHKIDWNFNSLAPGRFEI